jgi:glycosyltransferase involved in cell wall biosynthesis
MPDQSISAIHMPNYTERNPYQQNLVQGIRENGVNVEIVASDFTYVFSLSRFARHRDVIHLHWLQSFYQGDNSIETVVKSVLFPLDLLFAYLLGANIVWTVHNVRPHEVTFPRLYATLGHIISRLSEAIHVHGEPTIDRIIAEYHLDERTRDKCVIVPHGNYINNYRNDVSKDEARETLGVAPDDLLYLFLGNIRPYKGVPELIDAFQETEDGSSTLIIAGKSYTERYERELSNVIADHENIRFVPEFIPEDEVEIYFNGADVSVFPFRSVLTSGSILLAFSFGCPAVVPNIGNVGAINEGTIFYDPNAETVGKALSRAKKQDLERLGEEALLVAQRRDWDTIGSDIVEVYKTIPQEK